MYVDRHFLPISLINLFGEALPKVEYAISEPEGHDYTDPVFLSRDSGHCPTSH